MTAGRVAAEELGLQPGATVTLQLAADRPITYHALSESADVPTFYVQSVFRAFLHDGARLASRERLAWVPLADVVAGRTAAPQTPSGTAGQAGKVSRTTLRIVEALGYC